MCAIAVQIWLSYQILTWVPSGRLCGNSGRTDKMAHCYPDSYWLSGNIKDFYIVLRKWAGLLRRGKALCKLHWNITWPNGIQICHTSVLGICAHMTCNIDILIFRRPIIFILSVRIYRQSSWSLIILKQTMPFGCGHRHFSG
jgi:hypothetical protein